MIDRAVLRTMATTINSWEFDTEADAPPTCVECEYHMIRDGEPTPTCDACAHSYVAKLAAGVVEVLADAARIERLEAALYSMIDCFDGAVASFEDRGKGGQHVSYHGDFASIPPSAVGQMRRWSRDLRAAIAGTWPMTRAEYAAAYPSTTEAALDEIFTRRTLLTKVEATP